MQAAGQEFIYFRYKKVAIPASWDPMQLYIMVI